MAPKLWVLTLLLMTAAGKRLIARDNGNNRTSCYQCEGVGRCAGRCEGVFCMKAVHRQTGDERRGCLSFREPDMPGPGECRDFRSELGAQTERICLCDTHLCNLASTRSTCSGLLLLAVACLAGLALL